MIDHILITDQHITIKVRVSKVCFIYAVNVDCLYRKRRELRSSNIDLLPSIDEPWIWGGTSTLSGLWMSPLEGCPIIRWPCISSTAALRHVSC